MNILEKFVKNDFNIDALKNLDEVKFNINTKDLELVIDANIATNLSKYQNIVSTMYCLGKYGSFDIRKLTLDEKNRLSLKFVCFLIFSYVCTTFCLDRPKCGHIEN